MLVNIVEQSNTLSEVAEKLGFSSKSRGTAYKISTHLKNIGISTDHFVNWNSNRNIPTNMFLVKDSNISNTALKKRLIGEGVLPYVCVGCGNIGNHNGVPLTLQLDHIDGDNTNNEFLNLRFLCPNCHSQTDTFGGKNKKCYN